MNQKKPLDSERSQTDRGVSASLSKLKGELLLRGTGAEWCSWWGHDWIGTTPQIHPGSPIPSAFASSISPVALFEKFPFSEHMGGATFGWLRSLTFHVGCLSKNF